MDEVEKALDCDAELLSWRHGSVVTAELVTALVESGLGNGATLRPVRVLRCKTWGMTSVFARGESRFVVKLAKPIIFPESAAIEAFVSEMASGLVPALAACRLAAAAYVESLPWGDLAERKRALRCARALAPIKAVAEARSFIAKAGMTASLTGMTTRMLTTSLARLSRLAPT